MKASEETEDVETETIVATRPMVARTPSGTEDNISNSNRVTETTVARGMARMGPGFREVDTTKIVRLPKRQPQLLLQQLGRDLL